MHGTILDIYWEQLQEIDAQKSRFERNVLAFLAGFPANHMLLTGARGTGKSSLVKAMLPYYAALLVVLVLLIAFPGIVTWLPNLTAVRGN